MKYKLRIVLGATEAFEVEAYETEMSEIKFYYEAIRTHREMWNFKVLNGVEWSQFGSKTLLDYFTSWFQ